MADELQIIVLHRGQGRACVDNDQRVEGSPLVLDGMQEAMRLPPITQTGVPVSVDVKIFRDDLPAKALDAGSRLGTLARANESRCAPISGCGLSIEGEVHAHS